ncbi:hypothetical protein H257_06897 [Aphanomyces astaci]|uniref:Uncharacterized protein n=1 Tax=Aphanomyces astaci TaxID=112090 RepID=W4GIX1_APHAT|nr:hypothetical protein H257_06897 [Aphanomyces astaci]ETV79640.1 hypothetical protein H257_06897 [Aphanomyces astaci]|eukprot:XP_009830576.1 hypothetical protein H257_06897 [Aphanomyces astaci]
MRVAQAGLCATRNVDGRPERNLKLVQHRAVFVQLLERSQGGKIPYGNSGRKKTRTAEEIKAAVQAVPHHARQTTRTLAANSEIPKTTLLTHMKQHGTLKAR